MHWMQPRLDRAELGMDAAQPVVECLNPKLDVVNSGLEGLQPKLNAAKPRRPGFPSRADRNAATADMARPGKPQAERQVVIFPSFPSCTWERACPGTVTLAFPRSAASKTSDIPKVQLGNEAEDRDFSTFIAVCARFNQRWLILFSLDDLLQFPPDNLNPRPMDFSKTAQQYAPIVSAVMALLTGIPTVISFYSGWSVTIRRTLGVICCISLGIAIGTFIVSRAFSEGQGDAPGQLTETKTLLQTERAAHEAAERRAEQAEQQAKNERSARETADQKVGKLESTVGQLETKIEKLERKVSEKSNTPSAAAAPPEVTATPTNLRSDQPSPRQKLERFIVEVTRAQTHGESATVYVRFTNTTNARIKMLLADGFLGQNKTFLVDDSGQQYSLDNSSGIGKCCFGFAGGDWQGAILDLEPKGMGDITLTFRRRNRAGEVERQPQSFTLSAELTVGDVVKLQDWPSPQWQSSGSAGISVAGIVRQ
jgi:hypothetical protein